MGDMGLWCETAMRKWLSIDPSWRWLALCVLFNKKVGVESGEMIHRARFGGSQRPVNSRTKFLTLDADVVIHMRALLYL